MSATKRQYINHTRQGLLRATGKASAIIADGGQRIEESEAVRLPPAQMMKLVAVVRNPAFDAALHVAERDNIEMILRARNAGDQRPIIWVLYDHAAEYAGRPYIEEYLEHEARELRGEATP